MPQLRCQSFHEGRQGNTWCHPGQIPAVVCGWHQLRNFYLRAEELYPNEAEKVREIVKAAKTGASLFCHKSMNRLDAI